MESLTKGSDFSKTAWLIVLKAGTGVTSTIPAADAPADFVHQNQIHWIQYKFQILGGLNGQYSWETIRKQAPHPRLLLGVQADHNQTLKML